MNLLMIFIILSCLFFTSTVFLLWKLYTFSIIIIDIEDAIEESLDILNQRYKSMNDVLQKPIFFDSVEVRQVIADIKESHRSVLVIANKLTKDTGFNNESNEKKDS